MHREWPGFRRRTFIDTVGEFIGKDVAVVRKAVGRSSAAISGSLGDVVNAGAQQIETNQLSVSFYLPDTPNTGVALQFNSRLVTLPDYQPRRAGGCS